MSKDDDLPLVPEDTRADQALELVSVAVSIVPWLGGPLSAVLSGASFGRKWDRVKDVVNSLAVELRDFKSEVSERYVKTDEFQELLENALRKAAEERNEDKRHVYRDFIVNAIKRPGSYDAQLELLHLVGQLSADHLRVLRALLQKPADEPGGLAGTPMQTLHDRLPEMDRDRLGHLVQQLNGLHVSNLQSLNTLMTARGAADLRYAVTPLGHRVLELTG